MVVCVYFMVIFGIWHQFLGTSCRYYMVIKCSHLPKSNISCPTNASSWISFWLPRKSQEVRYRSFMSKVKTWLFTPKMNSLSLNNHFSQMYCLLCREKCRSLARSDFNAKLHRISNKLIFGLPVQIVRFRAPWSNCFKNKFQGIRINPTIYVF